MRYQIAIGTSVGTRRAEGTDEHELRDALDVVAYWRKHPQHTVQEVA